MTKQDRNRDAILDLAKECGFKFGLRKITCDEAAIISLVARVRWIAEMDDVLSPSSGGENHVRM